MTGAGHPSARRAIDLLGVASAVLCVLLAWASRHHLNLDGVSYLDLAARLRAGDWPSFVQGYWSPLYPALLAVAGTLTGQRAAPSLPVVHAVNALIALGIVALLWRTLRRRDDVVLARLTMAALFLAATRPPRIDAVTPDLLLVLMLVVVALELLEHDGRRWILLGLALGGAYLAKTSAWPCVALAIGVLLWRATRTRAWRPTLGTSAVALGAIALWAVPVSVEHGRPVLESASRLNRCWYLAGCDARSPDTHEGTHDRYATVAASADSIVIVDFGETPWTYAPWGDPVRWDAGVRTETRRLVTVRALLTYWWAQSMIVWGYWLAPLILGVLLPALRMAGPRVPWRALAAEQWPALLVLALGLAGIAQFVALHAEPRLIAPYALLVALGTVWWLHGAGALAHEHPRPRLRARWLSWAGLVIALPLAAVTIGQHLASSARIPVRAQQVEAMRRAAVAHGLSMDRVVVVGSALPLVADAWRAGVAIVGQIPPRSLTAFASLGAEQQGALLRARFGDRAQVAWVTTGGDGFRLLTFGNVPISP
ncbi:MAG TPA: hypothetical protein VF178_04900 [Gemmatimonadaceae bacterium]